MAALQLLLIDKILEDGEFYMVGDDDDIIAFSAIYAFMKRNFQFSSIPVIFYDYSFRVKTFNISSGSV